MDESMTYNPGIFQFYEYNILRIMEIIEANKTINHCDYLFTGDSITQGLDVEKFFRHLGKVVNTGISGMTSGMLLHLMDEAILKFHPKRVVYMIGTNDLNETCMSSPKEIANHIKTFCEMVIKNIKAEILIISPLPCDEVLQGQLGNPQLLRSNVNLRQIFHETKALVDDQKVQFLSLHDAFLNNNTLRKELFSDGWHLNDDGYQIYQQIINDFIETW